MSEQDGTKATALQRPVNDDKEAWKKYWKGQGQPWRIEPEIDMERQQYLAQRRAIMPDIEQGIYPFKDINLSRADVEWLLATHEDGRGPVDWRDKAQREREGLDLRGADLRHVDLSFLPLACMQGGLGFDDLVNSEDIVPTMEQFAGASILLEEADLHYAHLEGACLEGAHLKSARFDHAHLEEANLREAQLEEADLAYAHLEGALLHYAQLNKALLSQAQLERAVLIGAQLEEAYLIGTRLGRADLGEAQLGKTHLGNIILSDKQRVGPFLTDITWGNTNLAVVNWLQMSILGDEYQARQKKTDEGKVKNINTRLESVMNFKGNESLKGQSDEA